MLSRRAALAAVVALALLAGPAVAACGNCCPPESELATVMSLPACCGGCVPSLDSAKDPVPAAVKKATNANAVAVLAEPTVAFAPNPSFSSIAPLASPSYLHAHSPPAPLRL